MQDPPRKFINEAISDCFKAGINVIMITGDIMETAYSIGKQIGLVEAPQAGVCLNGFDL